MPTIAQPFDSYVAALMQTEYNESEPGLILHPLVPIVCARLEAAGVDLDAPRELAAHMLPTFRKCVTNCSTSESIYATADMINRNWRRY